MAKKIYSMLEITNDVSFKKDYYDYLLLAPNVEKRSRYFHNQYRSQEIFNNIILFDYNNFHKNISPDQEQSFYDDFANEKHMKVKGDANNIDLNVLLSLGIKQDDNIAVDITGFSIPDIFQVMHMLKTRLKIEKVDVFYTEPKFYVYDKGYYDAYHPNKGEEGERRCAPIIGYYNSGENDDEILIIFLGFDGGLAEFVYFKLGEESQETLETFVINGLPSYSLKLKDVSLFNNYDIITKIGSNKVRYAAANNPFSAYNALETLHKQFGGNILNVCSIGSKPMALGACLFALNNMSDVKVTYPFYEKTHFDEDEIPGKLWKYGVVF